jgi:acyl-CoA thioesterase-2
MIMAAYADAGEGKYLKTMNTVFARPGMYGTPIFVTVDAFQAGRTFGSQIVTAWQNDKVLTRALTMMTSDEEDLIAHDLTAPDAPKASSTSPHAAGSRGQIAAFPGSEIREAVPDDVVGGVPFMSFWHRMPESTGTGAESQAILAFGTNGSLIELAFRPHAEIKIEDAHLTLTTGVVNHTISFHRPFDAGDWIQIALESTFAGKGRVYGRGSAFLEDGTLVASFSQDSMVKPGGTAAGGRL